MNAREYKMIWMRGYRKRKRWELLISRGKCPVCLMLLDSPYHQPELAIKTFGKACSYQGTSVVLSSVHIHAKIEIT